MSEIINRLGVHCNYHDCRRHVIYIRLSNLVEYFLNSEYNYILNCTTDYNLEICFFYKKHNGFFMRIGQHKFTTTEVKVLNVMEYIVINDIKIKSTVGFHNLFF